MKRRGEVATALIIAILAALGIGAAVYFTSHVGQNTHGKMSSTEDLRKIQDLERWKALAQEIASELSGKFGEFSRLESYDFVPSVRTKWGDKTVYQAGDKYCFVIPEEFAQKFISLAEDGSLEVAQDGSKFSIDIRNGKNFNLEETLVGLLHRVSDLKSGVSSNYVDMNTVESKIVNQVTDKSTDVYGYVRFIFRTNVDDVYVVAVFSIDPNEVTHSKGRYIATGRKLLISRTHDEMIEDIKARVSFNQDFYILGFDLNADNALSSNNTAKECLENFISQFNK